MIYRSSNAFYLRLGRGDGEFGAAFEVPVDWQDDTGGGYGAARLASATPVAAPNTAGEISTGDLDGDGKIDRNDASLESIASVSAGLLAYSYELVASDSISRILGAANVGIATQKLFVDS
jgi:hypothetical protein